MDKSAVESTIQLYFDACYEGSGEKARQAFHPSSHIYGRSPAGELLDSPIEEFAVRVGSNKNPPMAQGQQRKDEILSIDFSGENTAVTRVRLLIGKTLYTDILSLAVIDGRWQIIAKLFSGEAFEG